MTTISTSGVAEEAGVYPSYVERLVNGGVLTLDEHGGFTSGDVR